MPEAKPDTADRIDPFLAPRDPDEVAADNVIREYLLNIDPPAAVFRQEGGDGYALIVPRRRGARMLTVPAAQEADFMWHGNPGTTTDALAAFIASAVESSKADHLKIPLLSRRQAAHLKGRLSPRLPDWRLEASLAAISPFSARKDYEPSSLKRAVNRSRREGPVIGLADTLPEEEMKALHDEQWGPNRGEAFFGMLARLVGAGLAEVALARTELGELVASQVDILGTRTRHCYYLASNTARAPGSGTALLGLLWRRYTTSTQAMYSFGRGAERYKYRFAERFTEWYALIGFYAPCRSDDLRNPESP